MESAKVLRCRPYKPEPKLVRCPFNPAHLFTQDRLQPHIIKCAKNYPDHYTCPFFNLHKFLTKEERDLHLFSCDKKELTMPWKYQRPIASHAQEHAPDEGQVPPDDEDWDDYYRNRSVQN